MAKLILLLLSPFLLVLLLPTLLLVGVPILVCVIGLVALAGAIAAILTIPFILCHAGAVVATLAIATFVFVGHHYGQGVPQKLDQRPAGEIDLRELLAFDNSLAAAQLEIHTADNQPSALLRALGEPPAADRKLPDSPPPLKAAAPPQRRAASGDSPAADKKPADSPPKPTAPPERRTASAGDKPPPWADKTNYVSDGAYYTIAKSGPIHDPSLRDEIIDLKMLVAAVHYIDDVVYRQRGVADIVDLDPRFLHEHKCLDGQWTGPPELSPNGEVLLKLKFDKRFRDDVDQRYRSIMSAGRVEKAGGVAAVVLTALAGLYSYLRLTGCKRTEQVAASPTP